MAKRSRKSRKEKIRNMKIRKFIDAQHTIIEVTEITAIEIVLTFQVNET